MDPGLKTKWIEALRSGEYIQGRGRLYRDVNNSYCCLGVLCEIQGREMTASEVDEDGHEAVLGELDFPPEDLCGGLSEDDMRELADMNDGSRKWHARPQSFRQIADYIEANL